MLSLKQQRRLTDCDLRAAPAGRPKHACTQTDLTRLERTSEGRLASQIDSAELVEGAQ